MSVHTGAPVEQSIVAVLHGVLVVQEEPAAQGVQVPPLHTMPAPHDVPSATLPVMAQSGPPAVQVIAAVLHGSPDGHDVPGTHVGPVSTPVSIGPGS